MNCTNCGKVYGNNLNFCPFCSAANPSPGEAPKKKGKNLGEFWRELPLVGKSLFIIGLIAIVAIVAAAIVSASKDETSSDSEQKKTVTTTENSEKSETSVEKEITAEPVTTSPPPAPPSWQTVIDVSSNTDKRTTPFYLGSGQKKLLYNLVGDEFSMCLVYLVPEGTSLETSGGFPEVTLDQPGSGETVLVNSPGNYYLDVTSANCTWQVTIQEMK